MPKSSAVMHKYLASAPKSPVLRPKSSWAHLLYNWAQVHKVGLMPRALLESSIVFPTLAPKSSVLGPRSIKVGS